MKVVAMGKVFTCVSWLMGLEGLSFALADDPALVATICERVGRFQHRVVETLLRYDTVAPSAPSIAFRPSSW
jgi:hypothetical protein